ncbi:MAG: homoserine kinase [Fusobacteriaceae bacterium]
MIKIKVPATTANLGPGFDSFGLALALYLEIEVYEECDEWIIEHNLGKSISNGNDNLIIETALKVFPKLKPHRLKMLSDIPLERGLGSSSSAIVAGIEIANFFGDLNLSLEEKVDIANEIEGHPDNIAPAILGGFIVSGNFDKKILAMKIDFSNISIAVVIPNWSLSTKKSREVLPQSIPYKEAIKGSSIANLMLASLFNNDIVTAGKMMEQDLWHEQYRLPLVPHLTEIREKMRACGAYSTCISGAGPTVIVFYPKANHCSIEKNLTDISYLGKISYLDIDLKGSEVSII